MWTDVAMILASPNTQIPAARDQPAISDHHALKVAQRHIPECRGGVSQALGEVAIVRGLTVSPWRSRYRVICCRPVTRAPAPCLGSTTRLCRGFPSGARGT